MVVDIDGPNDYAEFWDDMPPPWSKKMTPPEKPTPEMCRQDLGAVLNLFDTKYFSPAPWVWHRRTENGLVPCDLLHRPDGVSQDGLAIDNRYVLVANPYSVMDNCGDTDLTVNDADLIAISRNLLPVAVTRALYAEALLKGVLLHLGDGFSGSVVQEALAHLRRLNPLASPESPTS